MAKPFVPVIYPKDESTIPGISRKVTPDNTSTWDLNEGGLYSFKVVIDDSKLDASSSFFSEFVLPINPSNLSISLPFLINSFASTGGIVEEHSGIVYRTISISGSFGFAAGSNRTTRLAHPTPSKQQFAGVLANTLSGVDTTVSAASRVAINSTLSALPKLVSGINTSPAANVLSELGHVKINEFANYLISYAEFKKQKGNTAYRLIFVDRKNGVSYVVTPVSFDTSKDASDPHVTRYRVVFRAWDLAKTTQAFDSKINAVDASNPAVLNAILATLLEARAVVAAASTTIRGVVQDFDNVMGVVSEVGLLLKDITATTASLADFPELAASHWQAIANNFRETAGAISENLKATARQRNARASVDTLGSAASSTQDTTSATNPTGFPTSGDSAALIALNQQLRDNNNPFKKSAARTNHVDFLDQFLLTGLSLTDTDDTFVATKLSKVRRYTVADFDSMRSRIEDMRDIYSDALGLSDSTVDAVLDRVPHPVGIRTPSMGDFQLIKAMNDMVKAIDTLAATKDVTQTRVVDPFIRAQQNTNNSALSITSYDNGFPVPFPAGATLEQLATLYLGTPDKWIEIAIANNLKAPYVDEVGFDRVFTSNGTKNLFTVADASNLYLNQEITLSSLSQLNSIRRIVSIKTLTSGEYLIETTGDPNLNLFTVAHGAKLHTYLPNTVNSDKIIQIPTNKPVNSKLPNTRDIPATINLDRQQKAMGVDIAVGSNFDLQLDANGDLKMFSGLANAIQAVKLKLSIEKGSLQRHPEVGLGLQVGTKQTQTATEVRGFIEAAILGDDRFSAIQDLKVTFDGPTVKLDMRIKAANGSDTIPLSFSVT